MVFSPLSVSGRIMVYLWSDLDVSTQVLLSFNNNIAGSTRLDISSSGRLTRRVEMPALSAALIKRLGDSLPSIKGSPAVSDSAEWGVCSNLHIDKRASNSGSSMHVAVEMA